MILTGWTFTTYLIRKDSKQLIREELQNLFDICKKFFVSVKNLIEILSSHSHSYEVIKKNPVEENILHEEEQSLSLVQPVEEIEAQSLETPHEEDTDSALSSFSPEVVEVINEEEEKVA
tara:strand:- start:148 stop:504 length:357 start_codon:yes stop_codon:yes gene_type:complete